MKPEEKHLLRTRLLIVGSLVILSLFIYLAFFLRAKIVIEVAPQNSVVTIDNKPIALKDGKANFSTNLGKHTLRVETDNYIGFKEEINLKRGNNYSKQIILQKAPVPIEIGGGSAYIAMNDNNIFYQNTDDKLIYMAKIKFGSDGQAIIESRQSITSEPIVNVDNLIWSPSKELALLKRGSTISRLEFKKFDFVGQNETPFGSNIGDIIWSPDNTRVAYYYAPPEGEKSLMFADKSNGDLKRVLNFAELGIDNPYLAFSPDSQWIAIIPRNKNFDENKLYVLNVYSKELRAITDTGNQKEAMFSADSQQIIYSTFSANPQNQTQRELFVIKTDGSESKSLGFAARATSARYWSDPKKIFLLRNSESSKLILLDLASGKSIDFFFQGQSDSKISEIILNDQKNGAIFVSGGKLYFVKLEGNG
jgi:hypothetical protein